MPDHIWLQRFLCRACRSTFTVGPDDLLARRLYRLSTIVAALRFWVEGHSTFACRQRFDGDCPPAYRDDEDRQSWSTIRRWALLLADLLVAEPEKRELLRARTKGRGLRWLARESLAEADRFGDGMITPAMPNGP